jgi:hypothetical protein
VTGISGDHGFISAAPLPVISAVPLPSALPLFGAALFGLGGLGITKKKAAQAA